MFLLHLLLLRCIEQLMQVFSAKMYGIHVITSTSLEGDVDLA